MKTINRCLIVSMVLCLAPFARAQDQAPAARSLDLYFIDVMGGAATLLVTPERESILVDSGWPGFDDRDPKRIIHVLKDVAGCDHLDHLVTTHWHTDHYGGAGGLARRIEIRHFWDRGLPEDNDPALDFPEGAKTGDPGMTAYRRASEGKRKSLKPGDSIPCRGDLSARVLASGGKVLPPSPGAPANPLCDDKISELPVDHSDNARSLVIRFRFGEFDFLGCGDLTWNVERDLVCPHDLIGPIDLFQVTHHGEQISNHPTLIKTIAPTVTVMNNGPRKGGSPTTVKRLRSVASIQAAYQLHRNARTGPDENTSADLIANTDPAGGQFIHVSVAPGGSKFTVQIGADGARREFASR